MRTIADFLGVKYTDKLLEDIAEKCHFSKLKQQKAKELTDYSKNTSKDGSEIYYRKGGYITSKDRCTSRTIRSYRSWGLS